MNGDDILTAIVRMDANITAMIEKIDLVRADIQDHESRIRDIDRKQTALISKLTAAWIVSATIVTGIIGWLSPWQ
ncbi:MAG: hypothetical protein WC277_12205 [Bacilli bacterium]